MQPNLGGAIASFVSREQIDAHHREEGEKGLVSAKALAKKAGIDAKVHIGVGRQGEIVGDFCREAGRRAGRAGHPRATPASPACCWPGRAGRVIAYVKVPVTLVKK